LIPQHLLVYCDILLYVLKKFWRELPEYGEIIAPKHVETM